MSTARLMSAIAATDCTFRMQGRDWVGKCLICGGPLRFEAATGEGATIEHILPRTLGGTSDLHNLGITHARCNGEKGRRWDGGQRRRVEPDRYHSLVQRLQTEREHRWREPVNADTSEPLRAAPGVQVHRATTHASSATDHMLPAGAHAPQ